MTKDNKPSIFGSAVPADPATCQPRTGTYLCMAVTDLSGLADTAHLASTVFDNCTISIPLKLEFEARDKPC